METPATKPAHWSLPIILIMLAVPCWMLAGLLMVGAVAVRERLDSSGLPMMGIDGQPLYEYDAWATWKINWFPNCLALLGGVFILAATFHVIRSLYLALRARINA